MYSMYQSQCIAYISPIYRRTLITSESSSLTTGYDVYYETFSFLSSLRNILTSELEIKKNQPFYLLNSRKRGVVKTYREYTS